MSKKRAEAALKRRRLTDVQRAEIISAEGKWGCNRVLAEKFGVSAVAIWKIRHKKLYAKSAAELVEERDG